VFNYFFSYIPQQQVEEGAKRLFSSSSEINSPQQQQQTTAFTYPDTKHENVYLKTRQSFIRPEAHE